MKELYRALPFNSFSIRLKNGQLCLATLVAEEIRDRVKAFEPDSFNDKFTWPFIFPFALKAARSSFCLQSDQSVCAQFLGLDLGRVMFRPRTLIWRFFVCLYPTCTLPLCVHLHSNPLPGQLLLPFSFFMLNSNHYFQRKASPKLLYQVFVLGGGKLLSDTHSDCSASSLHFCSSTLETKNIETKKVRTFILD